MPRPNARAARMRANAKKSDHQRVGPAPCGGVFAGSPVEAVVSEANILAESMARRSRVKPQRLELDDDSGMHRSRRERWTSRMPRSSSH